MVLAIHATPPEEIVIDLDATEDPVRRKQEGREYDGCCRRYCLLPVYITRDNQVLAARVPRS